jgi:hypothetical protein
MGVYHAPWVIEVSRAHQRGLKVLAYWSPAIVPPKGMRPATETIQFLQEADHNIEKFTDVNIAAIAAALRRRITKLTAESN